MRDVTLMFKEGFTAEVSGQNPERFLNTAAANGIYISEATPVEGGLRLRLSKKAYKLMENNLPDGLELRIVGEHGAQRVLKRLRKRYLLFGGAVPVAAAVLVFSRFIWRVELTGGTPELRREVSAFLKEREVCPGTLKSHINQNEIKRDAILSIDDLMWLWVDLRGTSAYVRIAARSLPPEHLSTEPANVIARETGVVERITVLDGAAVVSEGATVEKGSILISGAIESERIETMMRHARGIVLARVWREKETKIPKVREKRNKTGQTQKIWSVKIKKFTINFSINSSILYPKYDKIRNKYKIRKLPVEFICDEYSEVETESEAVDLSAAIDECKAEFEKEATADGGELLGIDVRESDMGEYLLVKMTAECLTDIAAEVPLQ